MGDQESINVRLARMDEIQKAHQKQIEDIQAGNEERFEQMMTALNGIFSRLVVLEKWTWVTLGACGLATFIGPFIVKAVFPKL